MRLLVSILITGLLVTPAIHAQSQPQPELKDKPATEATPTASAPVEKAWEEVKKASQYFDGGSVEGFDKLSRQEAGRRELHRHLEEVEAAIKQFREVAPGDPRFWTTKVMEIQLAAFYPLVGRPEREPDTAVLAEEILTAPDAPAVLKEGTSATKVLHIMAKDKDMVLMSPKERGAWRAAAREHLTTYPNNPDNPVIRMALNSTDSDGDTPVSSGITADEAWVKLQAAIKTATFPSMKDLLLERDTEKLTKRSHEAFDATFKEFCSVAPHDPRRWEARLLQFKHAGWFTSLGRPDLDVAPKVLLKTILRAPDAPERIKEEVSFHQVITLRFALKAGGLTAEDKKVRLAAVNAHLIRFPDGKRAESLRTSTSLMLLNDAEEPADTEAAWKKVLEAMKACSNRPKELSGKVEESRQHMSQKVAELDEALFRFLIAAPNDPRRWTARIFEVEMRGARTAIGQPDLELDSAFEAEYVLAAPDVSESAKGRASGLLLLMAVPDIHTARTLSLAKKKSWKESAEAHLKKHPKFRYNANIQAALNAMETTAGPSL